MAEGHTELYLFSWDRKDVDRWTKYIQEQVV
jgi:hypothetical protein